MTYLWRAPEPTDKTSRRLVMHVEAKGGLGLATNTAICGTIMDFNQISTAPFARGRRRPVCRNCLRSCVDKRIAA